VQYCAYLAIIQRLLIHKNIFQDAENLLYSMFPVNATILRRSEHIVSVNATISGCSETKVPGNESTQCAVKLSSLLLQLS
jgi:hypothetical protein